MRLDPFGGTQWMPWESWDGFVDLRTGGRVPGAEQLVHTAPWTKRMAPLPKGPEYCRKSFASNSKWQCSTRYTRLSNIVIPRDLTVPLSDAVQLIRSCFSLGISSTPQGHFLQPLRDLQRQARHSSADSPTPPLRLFRPRSSPLRISQGTPQRATGTTSRRQTYSFRVSVPPNLWHHTNSTLASPSLVRGLRRRQVDWT